MNALRKEYDCFGPWLLEINNQEEVPPIFNDDYHYGDDVKFAFKIPVHVERRNTSPGSILYDSVISLNDDKIYIFNLVKTSVSARVIHYREILFIQNIKNLLKGELKIYISGEPIIIHYNTISSTVIDHVIELLRQKYTQENIKTYELPHLNEVPTMIPLFENLWNQIERKEQVAILNYQPVIKLSANKKSLLEKTFQWRYRMELQGNVFASNEKELIIISRINCTKYSRRADYSDMHTYIPFNHINDIKIEPNNEFDNLKNISIQVDNHVVVFKISKNLHVEEWVNLLR